MLYSQYFWSPNVFFSLPSQSATQVVCTVIQFLHYVPEVSIRSCRLKGSVSQDCSPTHFQHKSQIQIVTCASEQTAIYHTLSSHWITLLEWLTELRKTVYLLNYQFITKGYKSGTANGRDAEGKVHGEGCRDSTPSPEASSSQHLCMFDDLEAVQISKFMDFYVGFIMLT